MKIFFFRIFDHFSDQISVFLTNFPLPTVKMLRIFLKFIESHTIVGVQGEGVPKYLPLFRTKIFLALPLIFFLQKTLNTPTPTPSHFWNLQFQWNPPWLVSIYLVSFNLYFMFYFVYINHAYRIFNNILIFEFLCPFTFGNSTAKACTAPKCVKCPPKFWKMSKFF